jgi:hypothetical protein
MTTCDRIEYQNLLKENQTLKKENKDWNWLVDSKTELIKGYVMELNRQDKQIRELKQTVSEQEQVITELLDKNMELMTSMG